MVKLKPTTKTVAAAMVVAAAMTAPVANAAGPFESSLQIEKRIDKAAAESQKKIDNLADQTAQMAAEYKLALAQVDSLKAYNRQLRQLVESQKQEIASIDEQMTSIDETEKGVIPMMEDMINTLDQFIDLDIPFLLTERKERVQKLRDAMTASDVSVSEKYRQILEAYQIEMQYGDAIRAYRDKLATSDGSEISVDFLHFGRLVLVYLTLDGEEGGFWNNQERRWVELDSEYLSSIDKGIQIARKQAQFDLVKLPVPAAESAQ